MIITRTPLRIWIGGGDTEVAGFEISRRSFEVGSASGVADFSRHVAETGLCTVRPC